MMQIVQCTGQLSAVVDDQVGCHAAQTRQQRVQRFALDQCVSKKDLVLMGSRSKQLDDIVMFQSFDDLRFMIDLCQGRVSRNISRQLDKFQGDVDSLLRLPRVVDTVPAVGPHLGEHHERTNLRILH